MNKVRAVGLGLMLATFGVFAPFGTAAQVTQVSCNCSGGAICGSGAAGDPWRCCNLAQDSCATDSAANPCVPWQCSPKPVCCTRIPPTCGNCSAGIGKCVYRGPGQAPDDTVCSDGVACTTANTPLTPISCTLTSSSAHCLRDSDCDSVEGGSGLGVCSGTGASSPGNPSTIVNGMCCPYGTACDHTSNTCFGNNGTGGPVGNATDGSTPDNDVCQSGRCVGANTSQCTKVPALPRWPLLLLAASLAGVVSLSLRRRRFAA